MADDPKPLVHSEGSIDDDENFELIVNENDLIAFREQESGIVLEFTREGVSGTAATTRSISSAVGVSAGLPPSRAVFNGLFVRIGGAQLCLGVMLPNGFPRARGPQISLLSPPASVVEHPCVGKDGAITHPALSRWKHPAMLSTALRQVYQEFQRNPPQWKDPQIYWGNPPPMGDQVANISVGNESLGRVGIHHRKRMRKEGRRTSQLAVQGVANTASRLPLPPDNFPELHTFSTSDLQTLCGVKGSTTFCPDTWSPTTLSYLAMLKRLEDQQSHALLSTSGIEDATQSDLQSAVASLSETVLERTMAYSGGLVSRLQDAQARLADLRQTMCQIEQGEGWCLATLWIRHYSKIQVHQANGEQRLKQLIKDTANEMQTLVDNANEQPETCGDDYLDKYYQLSKDYHLRRLRYEGLFSKRSG